MAQQIDPGGRSGHQEALPLVGHHEDRLAGAERAGFEDVQPRLAAARDGQALPVLEQPDPAQEKSQHEGERADDAEQRSAGVREGGGAETRDCSVCAAALPAARHQPIKKRPRDRPRP